MKQSTLLMSAMEPPRNLHVAIIMDGNGSWATERGLARQHGHIAGASALRLIAEAAPDAGIRNLTVFAFSADNWKRPETERVALFALFEDYLRSQTEHCAGNGVELRGLGWRHRLPDSLRQALTRAEEATAHGKRLCLRIAIDYSSRAMIGYATALCGASADWFPSPHTRQAMDYSLAAAYGQPGRRLPPVDLLIRTGGEQRLSDFLLWESAYAELWFTPTLWPDFDPDCLRLAVHDFHARTRTFGALPAAQTIDTLIPAGRQP